MAGSLSVVATPIGNLADITLRALEVLKNADAIVCEDTRVTAKLLAHYDIKKPLVSCHEHTDEKKLGLLIERITKGENLAYVTDAGTPGLSDPGNVLVARAVEKGLAVIPIPGVSALSALVSVAGMDMREFTFLGFPPHKKGRQTFFQKVAEYTDPMLYYESPHRVIKNLTLLSELAPEKRIILGRELTKLFEEVVRGSVGQVLDYFAQHGDKVKGEFVIIAYTEGKKAEKQGDGI